MDKEKLGKRIKHRREVLGLTIRDIADLTNMSKTTISQIENGNGNPTFEKLKLILDYLNLELKIELKNN